MYFRTDLISRDKEYTYTWMYVRAWTKRRRIEDARVVGAMKRIKIGGEWTRKLLKNLTVANHLRRWLRSSEFFLSFFFFFFPLHFIPFLFIYFDLTSKKMFTSTYNSLKLFPFSVRATSISVFRVARKLPNEIFTWLFGKFLKRLSIRDSHVFSKNNSSPRQATFHLRYC